VQKPRGHPANKAHSAIPALPLRHSCESRNGEEKMRAGVRFNQNVHMYGNRTSVTERRTIAN